MSMLIDAIPSNELRNGYHVQYVDEVRHTGMQMALGRWYAKHAPDPGGSGHISCSSKRLSVKDLPHSEQT